MSPAEQLAGLLIECRRAGQPFARAWRTSTAQLDWPAGEKARSEWRQALAFAKREFRDAYQHPGSLPDTLTRLLEHDDATIESMAQAQPELVLAEL